MNSCVPENEKHIHYILIYTHSSKERGDMILQMEQEVVYLTYHVDIVDSV